jgi:hypothetical protein
MSASTGSGHGCALARAALCRYCCKSPKLSGDNFHAIRRSDRRPPIDVAPITLPRSPASLFSGNEVPHIFTRNSPVQPKEILITSAIRLLQQNLPQPDSCTAANSVSVHSTTSLARATSMGGISRPSALAVLRLMISSNFVGCSIGRSAGFAPLITLTTNVAARLVRSEILAP